MFTSRCGESLVVAVFRLYICLVQTIVATGPRSGKVRKNCFSSACFFSKARENSRTSSSVAVVRAVSI